MVITGAVLGAAVLSGLPALPNAPSFSSSQLLGRKVSVAEPHFAALQLSETVLLSPPKALL